MEVDSKVEGAKQLPELSPVNTDAQNSTTTITKTTSEPQTGAKDEVFVVVTRKEQLYEVDLEAGANKENGSGQANNNQTPRPKPWNSVRFLVIFLALLSPFVTSYSRSIINFAIIDMIEAPSRPLESHSNATHIHEQDSQRWDNSCPVSPEELNRVLEEEAYDKKTSKTTHGEKFAWDAFQQGLLKSAYTIGHTPLQIPGSRLSEIYGSYLIMSISLALIAVCCALAPVLASLHFLLLFMDLFFLGMLGSFLTPALITMFSNWLTPGEKSIMMSLYLIGSRMGFAASSIVCGLLFEAHYSWRYIFFSAGFVSIAYCFVFLLVVKSKPIEHGWVSELELSYLATKNRLVRESIEERDKSRLELRELEEKKSHANETNSRQQVLDVADKKKEPQIPWFRLWFAMLSNIHVWAFIMTKFCVKMTSDIVQIELPTYLKRVMHFSARDNGFLNFWNYTMFCFSCLIVGVGAKVAVKKKPCGMNKTVVRKVFQCTASYGVALILFGVGSSVCQRDATRWMLLSMFFITTLGIGGEGQMAIDLTDRYSGTLHAMASALAMSGAIAPTLVGSIIRGHEADKDWWLIIWYMASAISFIGGTIFLIFAKAELQSFESLDKMTSTAKKAATPDGDGTDNKAYLENEKVLTKDAPKTECPATHNESKQI